MKRVLFLAAVSVFAAAAVTCVAAALDRNHWLDGYVYGYNPTASSYTATGGYAYNRIGGAIQVTRPLNTTGQYRVKFARLSPFLSGMSTAHVTGYNVDVKYCKPAQPTLVNDVLDVRCFSASTGLVANAYYAVAVTRNYSDNAFAYADQPTVSNYAPQANASWNPKGTIQVARSGVGSYTLSFSGLGTLTSTKGGNVQVNAVGTGTSHCKVGSWGGNVEGNLLISVACFSGTGVPIDSTFNVLFVLPSGRLAYALADQPTTASYNPPSYYSSNPSGGAISIARQATGVYSVTWTGLVLLDGGDAQVTAYGNGNAQCKVEFWGADNANVRCFNPAGTLVDSQFTVLLAS